jgi:hypothetical protein
MEDPGSEVARLVRDNRTICLQGELGTRPNVYYIEDGQESGDDLP